MRIDVAYKGQKFISNVSLADNFWLRLSGYMFRQKPHHPGILFEPASGIHSFFMSFSLDLVFLDAEDRVVKVVRNMKPWRHTRFYLKARKVLELPVGILPPQVTEGEFLEVKHV